MLDLIVLFAPIVLIAVYFIFEDEIWIRIDMHLYRKAEKLAEQRMLDRIAHGEYDTDVSTLLADLDTEYHNAHSK